MGAAVHHGEAHEVCEVVTALTPKDSALRETLTRTLTADAFGALAARFDAKVSDFANHALLVADAHTRREWLQRMPPEKLPRALERLTDAQALALGAMSPVETQDGLARTFAIELELVARGFQRSGLERQLATDPPRRELIFSDLRGLPLRHARRLLEKLPDAQLATYFEGATGPQRAAALAGLGADDARLWRALLASLTPADFGALLAGPQADALFSQAITHGEGDLLALLASLPPDRLDALVSRLEDAQLLALGARLDEHPPKTPEAENCLRQVRRIFIRRGLDEA